jgi:hypothetical protein
MATHFPTRRLLATALLALGLAITQLPAFAQEPPVHRLYSSDMPTGTIGRLQLMKKGRRADYFQPVEISAPAGAGISLVEDGAFGEETETRRLVGMLIGQVYQLKVTNIPLNEGVELFPTIELLDRLCPPAGQELRFPIPIELTLEELDLAASGRYITRVIYLEDPRTALPVAQDPDRQRYYEIDSTLDPLAVADRIGRPMAILRMGSRVPTDDDLREGRVRQAPFMKYRFPAAPPPQTILMPEGQDLPVSEFHQNVPRVHDEQDPRWSVRPVMLQPLQPPPSRWVK